VLARGVRFGTYEVLEPIGNGGSLRADVLCKPQEVGAARAVSINDVGQVVGLYRWVADAQAIRAAMKG
jgi:hypothetical protein